MDRDAAYAAQLQAQEFSLPDVSVSMQSPAGRQVSVPMEAAALPNQAVRTNSSASNSKKFSRKISVPEAAIGVIIGRQGRNKPTLERMLGVSLELRRSASPGQGLVLVTAENEDAVDAAIAELSERTKNEEALSDFVDYMRILHWEDIHLFIDFSNIQITAQANIKAQALVKRVVQERDVKRLMVAGSAASLEQANKLKQLWETLKFDAYFQVRPAGQREECVDEKIICEAYRAIAGEYARQQTLVVLTGDGNDNGGVWASFRELIHQALQKGWKVEVWSWTRGMSRVYKTCSDEYVGNFKLMNLDAYRDEITYPRGTVQCKFFASGHCKDGNNCKFAHSGPLSGAQRPPSPAPVRRSSGVAVAQPGTPSRAEGVQRPNLRTGGTAGSILDSTGQRPDSGSSQTSSSAASRERAASRGRACSASRQRQSTSRGPGNRSSQECVGNGANTSSNLRAVPCKYFGTPSGCSKGDKCSFLHAAGANSALKREVCKFFSTPAGCRNGNQCTFKHEMQAASNSVVPRAKLGAEGNKACDICFEVQEKWFQFACGHKICKGCGDEILKSTRSCHMCRKAVSELFNRFD